MIAPHATTPTADALARHYRVTHGHVVHGSTDYDPADTRGLELKDEADALLDRASSAWRSCRSASTRRTAGACC